MIRLIAGVLFLVLSATAGAQQARQLAFREEIYDFGTIEEEQGPVTHEFIFLNNSTRPVKIIKVQASCGCTTPGWSKDVVPPGKEGFVQASYDPKGRPGFFNKSLTVTTDLEANPVILQIKGQVTSGSNPTSSEYPVAHGALRMRTSSFNMGRVYLKDEYVVREFPVINAGPEPVEFTGKFTHPSYIRVDVEPRTLAPGAKGSIKVSYNGALKNQYGFQSDNIAIETNDKLQPMKSFNVYATLEDFFPTMTAAELSRAPQLSLQSSALEFGNIGAQSATEKVLYLTNTGKSELQIRSVQPNCSCVTVTLTKRSLKPGESTAATIVFDPEERKGSQNKAITFYSNDPKNPVQRVTFTAYVQ